MLNGLGLTSRGLVPNYNRKLRMNGVIVRGEVKNINRKFVDLNMAKFPLLIVITLFSFSLVSAKKFGDVTELQIGIKSKPSSCSSRAHKGDRIKVHYRGMLTDGTVFDSSYERNDPFEFVLYSGQVIKGWDQGLLGMCVGEKRKLKIPAKLGYGDEGSPPTIPGGATLIFDTELVSITTKTDEDDSEVHSDL